MIAVIFEVNLKPNRKGEYLDIATDLRPILEEAEGFISVERFQSLSDPNRILSLSCFRDEHAVRQWRNTKTHREAQSLGRREVFAGYRLRVTRVLRDYSMDDRTQVPLDSKQHHDLP